MSNQIRQVLISKSGKAFEEMEQGEGEDYPSSRQDYSSISAPMQINEMDNTSSVSQGRSQALARGGGWQVNNWSSIFPYNNLSRFLWDSLQ